MAKVVQFNRFGGPEVLQLSEVDVSSPLPDEIQIQVKALGISHADTVLRTGKHVVQPEFPARLGFEAAGDVIAVGAACQDLKIGDRVAVIPLGCMKAGTYAEIINVRAACAVRISHDVTYEQAAATWLDYLLAYSALVETAKVHAGVPYHHCRRVEWLWHRSDTNESHAWRIDCRPDSKPLEERSPPQLRSVACFAFHGR
ncbi:alcohol dehydrogenase catalytic domain-containing protein [Burkholderia sp. Ax-1719]|uniref:alcohol dehydrogenase catalytic domain-containing protein n=1 Tax=Burkholderia sp. Ax-1719 TaxID=2608334 RepID=UPI00141FE1F3|nr:alcohol dehydrogenase catalytic domain-containing protein [Burkholderia sp. Ax-1719]NIE63071.1 alcohol dehydrogenase catalytic domain-containing protein [Burkholderia sp. Ax-1719]